MLLDCEKECRAIRLNEIVSCPNMWHNDDGGFLCFGCEKGENMNIKKPAAYNYVQAEKRIKELEEECSRLKEELEEANATIRTLKLANQIGHRIKIGD